MATATWIRAELDQRGVTYQELHHPEVFTAQAMAQREHVSGHRVAKVVAVLADDRPIELILPASRRVNLNRVRDTLGARFVRLASEDEMEKFFPDCERGAVPALRHWGNVEVLMDDRLKGPGDIVFQAGTHSDAVRMRFDDWFPMVNPRVASFSEPVSNLPRQALWDDEPGG
jgi:Ala-tRNA(Pro) deacylase